MPIAESNNLFDFMIFDSRESEIECEWEKLNDNKSIITVEI